MKNIGVSCFLYSPYNIVTWSHYGRNHTGFCVEYSVEDRLESHFYGYRFETVSYTNKVPVCSWVDFVAAPSFIVNTFLTTKYKDWAYEDEVRIISHGEEGGQLISNKNTGLTVKKIYIGCMAAPSGLLTEMVEVAREKGIKVTRLERHGFDYSLFELNEDDV